MRLQLPAGFTLQEAVTLPNNFVSVFHALTTDLALPLPWPKPAGYVPPYSSTAIVIWGGSSSVGQFALQILRYYGYRNLITTASAKHHALLKAYGAAYTFDYREHDVVEQITRASRSGSAEEPAIPFALDCIGSLSGSVEPLSKIAQKGTKIAILLPIIVKDSADAEMPEYAMDVEKIVKWEDRVEAKGVRTHFYLQVKALLDWSEHSMVEADIVSE